MSVDPDCPPTLSCSEAAESGDPSPKPEVPGPAETYDSPQMTEADVSLCEAASPFPSSGDLHVQETPDSSTSPCVPLPDSLEALPKKGEVKVRMKKQKVRTVFTQTQLCVLKDRFQRQKYLSLQQMQELSSFLNLNYKQVKTWFQNQRMKYKRWQKSNWQNSADAPQKGPAPVEYPGTCSNYAQGNLVNTSGNLPMWSNHTWNNSAWNTQSWANHSWNTQTWNSQTCNMQTWNAQTWNAQTWYPQGWNSPYPSCGEEPLQPCLPFPQSLPANDLEASLEVAGDSQKYLNSPQALDLFLNYAMSLQPEDL
ncbi:homeobox protein NANOG [Octodon degus]|uniref:Homeobox protein NANOG n=1 Tax=Octodon degus TaxID=10160 RepID=A0A6P3FWX7_OCTDE|nr:homeobox protein NANOG [Octodon degus]